MIRQRTPPTQTWRTILDNHVSDLVSVDFFTVPTATLNPTAQWTAQQIVEAFPFDSAPRYLLRDRDSIYGEQFRRRVTSLGIEQIRTAPRSPWQTSYVERMYGSIRRACLNHVIVLNQVHLRRLLKSYFAYYHEDEHICL